MTENIKATMVVRASQGSNRATRSKEGHTLFEVEEGSVAVEVVSSVKLKKVSLTHEDGGSIPMRKPWLVKNWVGQIKIGSGEELGRYAVVATPSDANLPQAEQTLTLTEDAASNLEPSDEEEPKETDMEKQSDGPAETAVGVYDPYFTGITLVVALVVGYFLLNSFDGVIDKVLATEQPLVIAIGDDAVINGLLSERVVAVLAVVGAKLAIILLVAGAWLAALEARGRLQISVSPAADKPTVEL